MSDEKPIDVIIRPDGALMVPITEISNPGDGFYFGFAETDELPEEIIEFDLGPVNFDASRVGDPRKAEPPRE